MKKLSLFFTAATLVFLGSPPSMSAGTQVITLTKAVPQAFPDVTSGSEGIWTYSVTVKGKVSFLGLNIKDSHPGADDICSHTGLRQPKGTIVVDTEEMIPAAAVNACGTDWPDDPNGTPFSLFGYIQTADPKASVVITVFYPD